MQEIKDRVLKRCPKAWCETINTTRPTGTVITAYCVHIDEFGSSADFLTEQEAWESADRFVNPSFYQQ